MSLDIIVDRINVTYKTQILWKMEEKHMKDNIRSNGKISVLIAVIAAVLLLAGNMALAQKRAGQWQITQYGDPAGLQKMFYTMEDRKGHFIVVDGGWVDNTEEVRTVIEENGNHVDAWILTHPHQDHIGAFMEIYDDPKDITIDKVYAVDMAPLKLCKENASWDEFGTYERFLSMEIPELEYVHTEDEWEIGNLKFKVLSAYEDQVDKLSEDLLNDGSMMFLVKAEKETMLFCADVGKSLSDHLVKKYGTELEADYIQMGHHGNGGLKSDFYQLVSPKQAFFDAPNWLFYDETGRYTTPQNREVMENMGSEVKNYETAPNTITLQ